MAKKICYVVTIGRTIEAFFTDQIQYLSDNGFDMTVICHDDCELKKLLPSKVRLFDVAIPRGISIIHSIKAYYRLKKIFRSERFDLVQYSTPNAALLASLASKKKHMPIRNYHLMGYRFESESGLKHTLLKRLEKTACRCSTHIECVCESTRQLGIAQGLFEPEKAVVVGRGSTGGVNVKQFDYSRRNDWRIQIRTEYDIEQDTLVYGFVGRIAVDKGIRELYQAWRSFSQRNKDAVLMLVGPCENEDLAEAGRNLPRVVFTGEVSDPERYFASMDVLVLPSYREGFGNVLIEAETMGVACIASDISGPRDAMSDGVTGILVPPRDEQALLDAMITMSDTEKRQVFSENAIEYAKEFECSALSKMIYERKCHLLGLE